MKKMLKENAPIILTLLFLIAMYISVLGSIEIYKTQLYKERVQDEDIVLEIYENITRECDDYLTYWNISDYEYSMKKCIVKEANIVVMNVKYVSDGEDPLTNNFLVNKTPTQIYYNGNDCQGKFILWADILKQAGLPVYLIKQEGHVCGLTRIHKSYTTHRNETIHTGEFLWYGCMPELDFLEGGIRQIV